MENVKDVKNFDRMNEILVRLHRLRKTLCKGNCKFYSHVEACSSMKKDIQFIKENVFGI